MMGRRPRRHDAQERGIGARRWSHGSGRWSGLANVRLVSCCCPWASRAGPRPRVPLPLRASSEPWRSSGRSPPVEQAGRLVGAPHSVLAASSSSSGRRSWRVKIQGMSTMVTSSVVMQTGVAPLRRSAGAYVYVVLAPAPCAEGGKYGIFTLIPITARRGWARASYACGFRSRHAVIVIESSRRPTLVFPRRVQHQVVCEFASVRSLSTRPS